MESHVDNTTSGRLFKVKRHLIFIQGSNWLLSYGAREFQAHMNFNRVYCMGESWAERPEFYHHYVDRCGIQVSNSDGSLDHSLSLTCAKDTIKLLRNHASLALGVSGNERVPPPYINAAIKDYLRLRSYFRKEDVIDIITRSREEEPSFYLDSTQIYLGGSMGNGFANDKGGFNDGPCEM